MKLEVQIGKRVKLLRQEKKITLKELSGKTNLSVGYLSQFERGVNTISIDALAKIAAIFDVNLTYFLPDQPKRSSVILKKHAREVLDTIGSKYAITNLSTNHSDLAVYPRIIEILPSYKKETLKTYQHEGEEFIYVLEGILTFLYKDEVHYLYPGDTAHYQSSTPHNWANDTNMNVKIICVSTPNLFNKLGKNGQKV
ncbi:XRE family transcriptional regulator [Proteinivorax tanatarense]|uniref:XRE family transcriptional regulator n=1 Tax=Proteinivorax tanatarense TaxID=1260629 RepID=A0AAU7VMH1_9FIRM